MSFILQTTFSGSIMIGLYLAAKYCLGKKISNNRKQLMLRAAVLFYLMPLAVLNQYYVYIARSVFREDSKVTVYGTDAYVLYHTSNGLVLSNGIKIQIILAAVWGMVALGILMCKGIAHLRLVKMLGRLAVMSNMEETEDDLSKLKKEHGVKRRIRVYRNRTGDKQAFTLGCIHPIIFCIGDMSEEGEELVYAHEVVHIKRRDVFWKILMECACLVHWFNPLVWWLRRELEFVSEKSCDDVVLKGKGSKVRELYASLLLEFAKSKPFRNGFSISLSKKNKRLKERMENVMHEKITRKLGQFISLGIVVVSVMVSSFTALAYGMVSVVDVALEEDDSSYWGKGDFFFAQFDATEHDFEEAGFYALDMSEYTFLYDKEFVDEGGNTYLVEEKDAVAYAACQHQYDYGSVTMHVKDADAGCTVAQYEASRCSLCGKVKMGENNNSMHFEICPH